MTAPTTDLDAEHARAQQVLTRQAATEVQNAWRGLEPNGLLASWTALVGPAVVAAIAAGQEQSAALGQDYVAATSEPDPAATFVPASIAGMTAEGALLAEVAQVALGVVMYRIKLGQPVGEALQYGLHRLLTTAGSEIADAGRIGTQTTILTDRSKAGYERMVHLPACDRCILLAGRLYRHTTAFRRHPRCDCTMRPVTWEQWQHENADNSPRALFEAMPVAEQNRRFGAGNAEAIRQGADLSQVVNAARRGAMTVAGRSYTTSGTTVRGLAGKRLGELRKIQGRRYRVSQIPRPTAAQIIADSPGASREDLLSTLRRYGYVV